VFGLGLGYSASAGFSPASGLGTPIVTNAKGTGGLAASLCAEASSAGVGRPVVGGVTPASGPTTGGNTVTITGSGFPASNTGNVHVSFGTAVATVQSVTSTAITVAVPQSVLPNGAATVASAGKVDVTVTLGTGSGSISSPAGSASAYEYVNESSTGATTPTVSGIGPSGGIVAGGNTVTVYGSGFAAGGTLAVTFGGVAASSVHVLSDTELTAVVPAQASSTGCASGAGFVSSAACQVEVVVTTANGSSSTVPILPALSGAVVFNPQGIVVPTPETEVAPAATEYDYAPTPTITAITPDPADSGGTAPVTITGTGFNFDTFNWVNFGPPTAGASEQVQITSITPTKITIDPPAGSGNSRGARSVLPGGVSIQSLGGLSNVVRFSYSGIPAVRSLSALGGPSTGGTRITIHGSGLSDVTSVSFVSEVSPSGYGASASSVVTAVTPNSLVVKAPAGLPGPVDVEPCTTTGCARPSPRTDTFVYFSSGRPDLRLVTPRQGPAKGGTEVVMFGNNLDGAVGVRFGDHSTNLLASTTGFPDGDPYILAALSTPGTAGTTVKVTVLTRTGSARVLGGGTFHYLPSAPAPPRSVKVVLHGTEATVRWVAPASDGGSPITSYTVVATAAGTAPSGGSFPGSARAAVLRHITAGRSYNFRVVAYNASHGRGVWTSAGPYVVGFSANGYRLAAAAGSVQGFGSLASLGGVAGSLGTAHVVAIAATPDGAGYWLATSDGTVDAFGDATPFQFAHPASPVVGLAVTPTGDGYWEITASGEVFAFGRARSYGAPDHGRKLPSPVTGIASTPDGHGYYVTTASGAVYGLGDASVEGAVPRRAGDAVVAVAPNPDSVGYWVLTSSGKVYGLGTLGFGSPSATSMDGTAVGIAATPDGHGYWVASSAGAVYAFGDASFEGRAPTLPGGYVGIATN
ncbi:MAG: cell surface receptor domain protein, partial [Acidimicrobiaceae bacterium]|nr:cell surface receptor domain protein [Acidimicrobiaceae bacterium]